MNLILFKYVTSIHTHSTINKKRNNQFDFIIKLSQRDLLGVIRQVIVFYLKLCDEHKYPSSYKNLQLL